MIEKIIIGVNELKYPKNCSTKSIIFRTWTAKELADEIIRFNKFLNPGEYGKLSNENEKHISDAVSVYKRALKQVCGNKDYWTERFYPNGKWEEMFCKDGNVFKK